jgi:hypothetical protein
MIYFSWRFTVADDFKYFLVEMRITKNQKEEVVTMTKPQGINTRAIAEKLQHRLQADGERFAGVELFYDHGDSSNPEVCQPTSYMGRRYGKDATLSGLDIIITRDSRVIMAVEIEESTVRPKTIIGDVFGIALADRIRIQGKPYPLRNVSVIVAIATGSGKGQSEKYLRLERHLGRYFREHHQKTVKSVRIVPAHPDNLVKRIERLLGLEIGKLAKGENECSARG